jgi:hypothetical protein
MPSLSPLPSAGAPEFEDSDFDEYEDDFYDRDGNHSESGMFDAGGHLISERYADWADAVRDRMKEER